MLASEVITRAKRRLGDYDNELFDDSEYLDELNSIIKRVVTRLECYIAQSSVQLQKDQHIYDLPDGEEGLVGIVHDDFWSGRVLLSESYSGLVEGGVSLSNLSFNSPSNWGFNPFETLGYSARAVIRDVVSRNQFAISPAPAATEPILYNNEVYN